MKMWRKVTRREDTKYEIVKDFIKVGLDFVRGLPDTDHLELNINAVSDTSLEE